MAQPQAGNGQRVTGCYFCNHKKQDFDMAIIPKNRPKHKLPMTVMDRVAELISAVVLLTATTFFLIGYSAISDSIPMQYDFSGNVSRMGSKSELLLLLGVLIVIYAGLTVLQRYPHVYNYLVEITEENAERQYSLAVRMIRWLKLMMVSLFSMILVQASYPDVLSETVMFTGVILFVIATSFR